VNREFENIFFKEWEKLGEIKTYIMVYLSDQDISREIDEIVKTFIERPSHTYPLTHLDI
jgi:hypothetical protein